MSKKILSLIIALAIIISACPVSFAAEAEEADKIGFLSAFGLTNETAAPDKLLTRLELAEIYYKTVTRATEVFPSDYSSPYFSDINEEMATSVDFVYRLGLMNGIGGGLFDPNGTLTYGQLIKTMVSFLGYDVKAQAKGGYPNGYMLVASELDINDDIASGSDEAVTWEMANDVFLNASNADVAIYLNEELSVQWGKSYLSQYRGIKRASGVVTADNFSDYENDKNPYYGMIKIDGVEFAVLKGAGDIIKHGGEEANIMYQDGGKYPEVVYFQLTDNKKIVINGSDIEDVTDTSISYTSGGKTKKIKYNINNTVIMLNGSNIDGELYDRNILVDSFATKDGSLTCIDNDGNGTMDVIYISAYDIMVVGKVRDGIAYNKYATTPVKMIDLTELSEGSLVNIIGTPISINDIGANDILTYESHTIAPGTPNEKTVVTKVTVTVDQGGGIISGVTYNGSDIDTVTIADVDYPFAKSTRTNPEYDKLKNNIMGANVILYFGVDTRVADFKLVEDSEYSTGLIFDCIENEGLTTTKAMKIYNEKGSFEDYTIADKLTMHITAGGAAPIVVKPNNMTLEEFIEDYFGKSEVATTAKKIAIERQLIKYKVNADGKIYDIIKAGADGLWYMNEAWEGTISTGNGPDGNAIDSKQFKKSVGTFNLDSYITSSTKVFTIPNEVAGVNETADRWTEDAYGVTTSSVFTGNSRYSLIGFKTEEKSPLLSHVIYRKSAAKSASFHAVTVMLVENVSKVMDEEGVEATKVSGYNYTDGTTGMKRREFYLTSDCEMNTISEIEPGDIIGYSLSAANKIQVVYHFLDYNVKDARGDYGVFGTGLRHSFNRSNGTTINVNGRCQLPNPYLGQDSVADNQSLFVDNNDGTVTFDTNLATAILNGMNRFWGRVVEKTGSHIKVECYDSNEDKTTHFYFPIDRFDASCDVSINKNTNAVNVSCKAFDRDEIYDSATFGDDAASWAFVYMQGEYWRCGAIYNK